MLEHGNIVTIAFGGNGFDPSVINGTF